MVCQLCMQTNFNPIYKLITGFVAQFKFLGYCIVGNFS